MEKLRRHHLILVLLRLLTVFLIYFLCRALFFAINKSHFEEVDLVEFLRLSFWGLQFDLAALALLNVLFLLFAFLPGKFRIRPGYQKVLWHLFFWPNMLGIIANCIDFAYYPYILQRSTFAIFSFASREQNVMGLVSTLGVDFWYVPILTFVLVALLWWLNRKKEVDLDVNQYGNFGWKIFNVGNLILILGLVFVAFRGHANFKVRPIGIIQASQHAKKAKHSAIILNTPFSIFTTIQSARPKFISYYPNKEVEKIFSPVHIPSDTVSSSKNKKQKNVVVIIMESFSKEYSGYLNPQLQNGKYEGYMPFLDSLMQKSVVYCNAYANGRKSIMALPAIIGSIPSLEVAYTNTIYGNNEIHTLPNRLKPLGYQSAFYHGAENGSMNFESFTKIAGFDEYYGRTEYEKEHEYEGNVWGVDDEPFFQFFADGLKEMKKPFVATFFSLSSHTPFVVPEKRTGKFPKGPLEIHELIGYSDFALKQFFESIKNESWFNETIFVITADHCSIPYFPEYKRSAKQFSIPILFYEPGTSVSRVDSTIVQQLDIMPTVLAKLNYNKPYYAFGTNMNQLESQTEKQHFAIQYNYIQHQLIWNDYLFTLVGGKGNALYDLSSDPLQSKNLVGSKADQEYESMRLMKAFLQQYNNRLIENRFCSE